MSSITHILALGAALFTIPHMAAAEGNPLQPVPRKIGTASATRPAPLAVQRDTAGWCMTDAQRRAAPLSQQVLVPSCATGTNSEKRRIINDSGYTGTSGY